MSPHEAKRAGTAGALLDIAPDPQVADVRLSITPTEAHPSYGDCNGLEDGLRHLCVEQCGLAWDVAFRKACQCCIRARHVGYKGGPRLPVAVPQHRYVLYPIST